MRKQEADNEYPHKEKEKECGERKCDPWKCSIGQEHVEMLKKKNASFSENREKEISKEPCLDLEKFDSQVGSLDGPNFLSEVGEEEYAGPEGWVGGLIRTRQMGLSP